MTAVIYQILCAKSGRFYIGRTNNFDRRKKEHFSQLKRGAHYNSALLRIYNKYGAESLSMNILQMAFGAGIEEIEQGWLDRFVGHPLCINTSSSAWVPKHRDLSPEAIEKKRAGTSAFMTALNKDPQFSEKRDARVSAVMSANFKDPVFLAKHKKRSSERMSQQNKNESFLLKMHEGIQKQHQNPEIVSRRLAASNAASIKPVIATRIADGAELIFSSGRAAVFSLGVRPSAISQCCTGKSKTAYGYTFRFASEASA